MKKITTLLLLVSLTFFTSNSVQAQSDIFTPSDDKATVYVIRPSGVGAIVNFKYFIDSTYIGKCNYSSYFKLHLKPGKHLIWAKSENRSFIEADLEAGKTYMINAVAKMGGFKAGVQLVEGENNYNERQLKRIKKYFTKKKLITFSEEDMAKGQEKYQENVDTGMERYNKLKSKGKDIPTLTKPIDMEPLLGDSANK